MHVTNLGVMDSEEVLQNRSFECLYLVGAAPQLNQRYGAVIVQDMFLPETEFDLFLPAATFTEVDGTLIDIEGKARKIHKAVEPPGKSKPDEWIIREITSRLDFEMMHGQKSGAGRSGAVERGVAVTGEYPFHLVVWENCYRFRNKALSKLLRGFERLRRDDRVRINPEDAAGAQVRDGEEVKITGKGLNITIKAIVTEDVPKGVIFAYHDPGIGLVKNAAVNMERS
jgi:predicted molibdopterin-dependent oxidoreductase YjgC